MKSNNMPVPSMAKLGPCVSSVYQVLVTGILVILAVATDQMSRKGVR
jgi:hypothetical protein